MKSEQILRSAQDDRRRRRGVTALDYMLVLCVILPMVLFIVQVAPKMMRLVYEMTCVLVSWPFM